MAGRVRVIVSSSAAVRRAAARSYLIALPRAAQVLLLAHSRGAADDLAREVALAAGNSFGLRTGTLGEYAATLVLPELARAGLAPVGAPGLRAVVARAVFDADAAGLLAGFGDVRRSPGFVAAVAATLGELRANAVSGQALRALGDAGRVLGVLLEAFERTLRVQGLADHTALLQAARHAVASGRGPGPAVVLLDPCLRSAVEASFSDALLRASPGALVTIPAGDEETVRRVAPESPPESIEEADADSLGRVRRFLFSAQSPPQATPDEGLTVFSAPGEARECVEIARIVLREARGGVPFDRMAVFVRSPALYAPILDSALRRAGVPAYFCDGPRAPEAAGRAFLALLDCAAANLARDRFVEYVSLLGSACEAPEAEPAPETGAPPPERPQAGAGCGRPDLELLRRCLRVLDDPRLGPGIERWRGGLAAIEAERRCGAGERDAAQIRELRQLVERLLAALAALGERATGRQWRERLEGLAGLALAQPAPVLEVLRQLTPMDEVPALELSDLRGLLRDHLGFVEPDPPRQRYGRVFVGGPEEARGRQFAVVFVPGLAERMFPLADREDPLLPDACRMRLDGALRVGGDRVSEERLRLRLAVGAATERLYVSYPRLDVVQSRPRVPSFYPLDLLRAATGRLPDLEAFERDAARRGGARLGWPAPADPQEAIDAAEHDLALLGPLLRAGAAQGRGRMRYLLDLHPHLARSLRARWQRWELPRWVPADGLIRRTPEVAGALDAGRLAAGAFGVSALERYSVCPYAFFLASVHGFPPRRPRESVHGVDRAAVAEMVEEIRRRFLRERRESGRPSLEAQTLPQAREALEALADSVALEFRPRLLPRISRIWEDEVESARASLRGWLRIVAEEADRWEDVETEEGLAPGHPVPQIGTAEVPVHPRMLESVGRLECRRGGSDLRVTEYRTGSVSAGGRARIQGGEALGAAVGALALETLGARRVSEVRIFWRGEGGATAEQVFPFDAATRALASQALLLLDSGIAAGRFPPAPRAGACAACGFAEVCGPYEEIRWQRKDRALVADLLTLRGMR